MKKLCNWICFSLIGITILFGNNILVYASPDSNIQTYVTEEEVLLYFPYDNEQIDEISVQIGKEKVNDIDIKSINDLEDCYINTIILFDNSLSISTKNREKMKDVAKGLIQNHVQGEVFTFATFDTEIREIVVDSTDYEELNNLVDVLVFSNQDTYLRSSLYEVLNNLDSNSKAYQKIVILSDGSDDSDLGYTFDEMSALINEKGVQVYSIGSRYEGNISALEEMFALSRAAGSQFFLLDDIEDVNTIVKQINAENPINVACINIPDIVKDGIEKNIKIELAMDGTQNVFVTKAVMPFINAEQITNEETVIEPLLLVETDESIDEEVNKKNYTWIIIVGILVLLLVAGSVGLFIFIKKRKENIDKLNVNDSYEGQEGDEDEESTILMYENDDSTVLLNFDSNNVSTNKVKNLVLIEEYNSSNVLQCEVYSQVSVGRNETCDIVIRGDKSVSGKHCIISLDADGRMVIRDNNSSNGTYLNSEKLNGEKLLKSRDVLEIGRLRYEVDIIGE